MKRLCALLACLLTSSALLLASPRAAASWIRNGVRLCGASDTQSYQFAAPDGAGGAIVVWEDYRGPISRVYAQRVTADGAVLWQADGIPILSTGAQTYPQIVSDGAGGAIVAWMDYRASSANSDIYAQRIDGAGTPLWGAYGVSVCTAIYLQKYPCIISDGAGGAIVVWEDYRAIGGTADIYAQRISAEGQVQWTADGVVVCGAQLDQLAPWADPDGAGGAVVVWNDFRDAENGICAQRIDATGAALWTADGIEMYAIVAGEQYPWIVGDGTGGAIVAWTDSRGGEKDVYAQRVGAAGAFEWDANSVPVCSAGGDQVNPVIAPDGAGGVFAAWMDFRAGDWDVYAQRVSSGGNRMWTSTGVPVSEGSPDQGHPVIVADGQGGAVIAWEGVDLAGETSYNVYGQRLGSSGDRLWPHDEPMDGTPVCEEALCQLLPRVVPDGAGGAIFAWMDFRSDNWDIYAQRVRGSGGIVATLLQSSSIECSDGAVRITWTLSAVDEGVEFRVLRARADGEVHGEDAFGEMPSTGIAREGHALRFVDGDVEPGGTYLYRVDVVLGAERRELFTTDPVRVPALPLTLFQNHPNPLNPSTTIPFYLPERGGVRLAIYDARGALVRRLLDGLMEKGKHSISWDGCDGAGRPADSGVYFCRLEAGKSVLTRKMILLR